MAANGDPRCEYCHGRGGMLTNGRWYKCGCVTPTRNARDWNKYLNSIGAANPAPKPPTR
jgi:hypothetical protein